jgi:hypothetical protein
MISVPRSAHTDSCTRLASARGFFASYDITVIVSPVPPWITTSVTSRPRRDFSTWPSIHAATPSSRPTSTRAPPLASTPMRDSA